MKYIFGMQEFNRFADGQEHSQELGWDGGYLGEGDVAHVADVAEQVAVRQVIQDDVNVVGFDEEAVELHDVLVVERLVQGDLSVQVFNALEGVSLRTDVTLE
jgi:hypothetical protein